MLNDVTMCLKLLNLSLPSLISKPLFRLDTTRLALAQTMDGLFPTAGDDAHLGAICVGLGSKVVGLGGINWFGCRWWAAFNKHEVYSNWVDCG